MENFDVIIVGAGPAGLYTSEKLAKKGLNVLCVDKKQEIGVPKRCGEGLGLNWLTKLGIEPDKRWAVQEIVGAALYIPSGKKVEMRFPEAAGYVIERRIFEKELAFKAAKAGAKIRVKSNVLDLKREDGKVNVSIRGPKGNEEYSADLIIAADGVETQTARKLGVNTVNKLKDIDSGYQYEMSNIDFDDPDLISLWFGTDVAPRGYVWIFPKGNDHANVGIGIGGSEEKSAKEYLDNWIATQPGLGGGSIIEVNAGAIPVGGFLEDMTADNLMIIGDAAHQVNPIHGGGMGIAMEAGSIAADVAVTAFEKKNFSHELLQEYNKIWYNTSGNRLMKILRMRYMIENLTNQDFNTLGNALTGDDIILMTKGDLLGSAAMVSKKLIKHPKLAKLMLKYMI